MTASVHAPAGRDDIGAQFSCRSDRRRAHPAGAADHDDALAGQVQPGRQPLFACSGRVAVVVPSPCGLMLVGAAAGVAVLALVMAAERGADAARQWRPETACSPLCPLLFVLV